MNLKVGAMAVLNVAVTVYVSVTAITSRLDQPSAQTLNEKKIMFMFFVLASKIFAQTKKQNSITRGRHITKLLYPLLNYIVVS